MYAIVEINGQQFKAEAGKKLFVHHIKGAQNDTTVEFDRVLLLDNDGAVTVGAPTVEGAKVVCYIGNVREMKIVRKSKDGQNIVTHALSTLHWLRVTRCLFSTSVVAKVTASLTVTVSSSQS